MTVAAVGVALAGMVSAGPAQAADVPVYRGQGASACTPGYLCLYGNRDFNAPGPAPILRLDGCCGRPRTAPRALQASRGLLPQ
ncbi:hypothetical protein [Streptomyces sp. NPDC031705]|uniref:hypothetical protein n=1 Tax=Streptomyces sp. NPDC031705 TaxID=3155729 RepID=UPI003408F490